MKRKLSFFIVVLCVTCTISKAQTTSIVVMEDKTPYGMQTYFSSGNGGLQTSEIKSYWDQNYYITSVAYGSFGWFVTMSQGTGWTDQSYSYRNRWPDDWVQQQKSAGNYITSLASSENMWLVVTSANSDYSAQEICAAPWSSLKEWIGTWRDKGYYITSIACQKGLWTVVMSKTYIYKDQMYFWSTSTDNLKKRINEKWDEGYEITALEYGNGEYFCIMSKYNSSKQKLQYWIVGTIGLKKEIKKYWDMSWSIIYVGG